MNKDVVDVEMRLNNFVYKCALCSTFFNMKHKTAHAVSILVGTIPTPQGARMNIQTLIMCQDCYKKNDKEKGLKLEEPSQIIKPSSPGIQLN